MEFERITPEMAGISSKHIIEFMNELKKSGTELHSFMFLRNGKVFAECYAKPYNRTSPQSMFSFTKILASLAIGFAEQEGILSLDDKIIDIFPEYITTENLTENLSNCKIEHLLTMSCGQAKEIHDLGMNDVNWIQSFFNNEFKFKPGTHFLYNTAGTNLLSVILKKKSGSDLIEFLTPRLFEKLEIGTVPCMRLPDGSIMGGAGSKLTTEQMAKIIQFVANGGKINSEQILSENYIKKATSKMISNENHSVDPDFCCGYGYQFWKCAYNDTYRADGAFGQFGIVVPSKDIVLIITSCSNIMQNTLSVITDCIIKNIGDKALEEDKINYAILKHVIDCCSIPCVISKRHKPLEISLEGKVFSPKNKLFGSFSDLIGGAGITSKGAYHGTNKPFSTDEFKSLTFTFFSDRVDLKVLLGENEEIIPISLQSEYNSFELNSISYGAVGSFESSDTFNFTIRSAVAPTGKNFTLKFNDSGFIMKRWSTYNQIFSLTDILDENIIFNKI